jgi:hypothetical protein
MSIRGREGHSSHTWWTGLTDDEKRDILVKYEKLREWNKTRPVPWPDMRDLTNTRLSKFNEKDIYCVSRFKDYYNNMPI